MKTKKTQGEMVEMRQIWFETRFYLLNFLYFPFPFKKDFFLKDRDSQPDSGSTHL